MPELIADGFEVTGLDIVDPAASPDGWRFVEADLTDAEGLATALESADLVVHAGSIHPWKPYDDAQYWDSNVKGAWNLYSAAAALGIGRVVLTSSICAGGCGPIPVEDWPVDEDYLGALTDIYSVTKNMQETIAKSFVGRGVRTIAMRPPAFMPVEGIELGFRLLGGYAVVEDVVSAHVAAVRVMSGRQGPGGELGGFEAFHCTNKLPYGARDADIVGDGVNLALAQRHWPDAAEWLAENGFEGSWLPASYDVTKAKRLLGWEAAHGFGQWFERSAGNE